MLRTLSLLLLSIPISQATRPGGSLEEASGYTRLVCAFHVHSRFSNGDYSVVELAAFAAQKKIDVLGLTDSFHTSARYGIWPLRKLASRTQTRPGVRDHGVGSYLESLRAAGVKTPQVVLLAGVEVTPYYYWEGSPLDELVLHNFDRHLLVFGLDHPPDLENLPLVGNETWANTSLLWTCLLGPVSLTLAGVFVFWRWRKRVKDVTITPRWLRSAGIVLWVAAVVWIAEAYPFGSLGDPYSNTHSSAPYQRLIDYVAEKGGIAYWSYPEARYPDVRRGGAKMVSGPHPQDLVTTQDYTGFEGLYGDTITVTNPGGIWDGLLVDYLGGRRRSWPSVITGLNFHGFRDNNPWYQLHRGQTILWAASKTPEAVLEAMKTARGYAAFQADGDHDLLLQGFAVRSAEGTALSGQLLETRSAVQIAATLAWDAPPEHADTRKTRLLLVLDGSLRDVVDFSLPFQFQRTETLAPGRHYVRLMVISGNTRILSNPIFVDVRS